MCSSDLIRYQSARLTKNAVLELADEATSEITLLLDLDNPIFALAFLRSEDIDDQES